MTHHHDAGLDCWGPVVNLNRDPRWGRNGEGGAEDPYLMGELAASWTRGFQYGRANESVGYLQGVLTLKHYVANTLDNTKVPTTVDADGQHYEAGSTVSRHTVDVRVSNYMLQEYLAAFRSAVKAGAKGLMCSYNSVDGIPTCLSPMLKKARELWTGKSPWGGYITSDSDSVADAVDSHHYVSDAANASCMAVRDGGTALSQRHSSHSTEELDGVPRCNGNHTQHPHRVFSRRSGASSTLSVLTTDKVAIPTTIHWCRVRLVLY